MTIVYDKNNVGLQRDKKMGCIRVVILIQFSKSLRTCSVCSVCMQCVYAVCAVCACYRAVSYRKAQPTCYAASLLCGRPAIGPLGCIRHASISRMPCAKVGVCVCVCAGACALRLLRRPHRNSLTNPCLAALRPPHCEGAAVQAPNLAYCPKLYYPYHLA